MTGLRSVPPARGDAPHQALVSAPVLSDALGAGGVYHLHKILQALTGPQQVSAEVVRGGP